MKLEEIKIGMEVKVSVEFYIIGKGRVISIIPDVPYPIEVAFGYRTGLFKLEELEKV